MKSVLQTLRSRGLVSALTHPGFEEACTGKSVYWGIDPTADGLHVGHLVGVMTLRRFQQHGYQPIALVGGATGMIGDPSGRNSERQFLSAADVATNVEGIQTDLSKLLDFDGSLNPAKMVNNYDWYKNMSAIDLLRDVGMHFRVNTMLSRDSVKSRLDSDGLTFTEFSYQLLQGYDFMHLYENENCRLQIGGSDQWGNIVSGVDLIRRSFHKQDAFGLTIPLLTTSSGEKIGKSAGNAVWLHPKKTSDYLFYQYFVNLADADVEGLLMKLTDLSLQEIEMAMLEHVKQPHLRSAQKLLAETVTGIVRNKNAVTRAQKASEILFGGAIGDINAAQLIEISQGANVPCTEVSASSMNSISNADLAVLSGICKSKTQAKKLVLSGGLYINNIRVEIPEKLFDISADTIGGSAVLLRSGKKNYHVIKILN